MKHILFVMLFSLMSKITIAENIYTKLEKNLLCNGTLNLNQIKDLVIKTNGHIPINKSGEYTGTYTIPFGLQVLNQNVKEFNIIKVWDSNFNDYNYVYMTPVPNLSPSQAAQLLGIKQDMVNKNYQKRNLSINVANGQTVLLCVKNLSFKND